MIAARDGMALQPGARPRRNVAERWRDGLGRRKRRYFFFSDRELRLMSMLWARL